MKSRRILAAVTFLVLAAVPALIAAQAKPQQGSAANKGSSSTDRPMSEAEKAADQAPPGQKSGRALANVSNEAARREEPAAAIDEYGPLKHSGSVGYMARHLGISTEAAYWLFVGLNFLLVGIALYFVAKKGMKSVDIPPIPQWLASRNELLRKNLEEAQRASADANRRLHEIEEKLARIGTEVSALEKNAAAAADAEHARLQSAADEEKQRIVRAAQQEIAAAASSARRELRSYAADLAIGLAEKKIKVDAATDKALVRDFVERLGKNGN